MVDIEITPGHDPKVTTRLIDLDEKIKADEQIDKEVSAFSATNVRPGMIVTAHEAPGTPTSTVASTYYASTLCKACHINEYEDWQKTAHARALATLVDAKRVSPECLSCHSEMFRRLRRVTVLGDNLGSVECGTCHMNSLPHGMERRGAPTKASVDKTVCLSCHTKDKSPNYNAHTYFPKVVHAVANANPKG